MFHILGVYLVQTMRRTSFSCLFVFIQLVDLEERFLQQKTEDGEMSMFLFASRNHESVKLWASS